jgi:hypothetical protein
MAGIILSGSPSSFSQGFRLFAVLLSLAFPSSTVFGISLIPGIGLPFVIRSTMCANEVGYGAAGSAAAAVAASLVLDGAAVEVEVAAGVSKTGATMPPIV